MKMLAPSRDSDGKGDGRAVVAERDGACDVLPLRHLTAVCTCFMCAGLLYKN